MRPTKCGSFDDLKAIPTSEGWQRWRTVAKWRVKERNAIKVAARLGVACELVEHAHRLR
jgi:hypothetical protein